jgi:hypothetical protein
MSYFAAKWNSPSNTNYAAFEDPILPTIALTLQTTFEAACKDSN